MAEGLLKQIEKKYEGFGKKGYISLMSDYEFEEIEEEYTAGKSEETNKLIDMANKITKGENPGKFESLPSYIIAYAATSCFKDKIEDNLSDENKMKNLLEQNVMNPIFRQALEAAANSSHLSKSIRDKCYSYSVKCNELVMSNSLDAISTEEKDNIMLKGRNRKAVNAMVASNRLGQITMAKTLFMAQIGNIKAVQKNGANYSYNGSVSELFAHGGRTGIFLGQGQTNMQESLFNDSNGKTNVYDRGWATHDMKSTKKGAGANTYKEKKGLLSATHSNNYALNPAIGGLGKKYGSTIENNGRDGHMYIRKVDSTADRGGYLLVGFEGEQAGKTGRAGHGHNASGSSARVSAFMAGKGGAGVDVGGRRIDLTGISGAVLDSLLKKFSKGYEELQEAAYNSKAGKEALDKYRKVNSMLCGKKMSATEIVDMLKLMNVDFSEFTSDSRMNKNADEGVKDFIAGIQNSGEDAFKKMNDKAGVENVEPQGVEKYSFGENLFKQFQMLSNALNKAKKKVLKIFTAKDSDEMKRVKKGIGKIVSMGPGDVNRETAKSNLEDLSDSTTEYINNSDKKENTRKSLVREVNTVTNRTLREDFGIMKDRDMEDAMELDMNEDEAFAEEGKKAENLESIS